MHLGSALMTYSPPWSPSFNAITLGMGVERNTNIQTTALAVAISHLQGTTSDLKLNNLPYMKQISWK